MAIEGMKFILDLWDENTLKILNPSALSDGDFSDLQDRISKIRSLAAGDGLLALETILDEQGLPEYLREGLPMVINGTDSEELYSVLTGRLRGETDSSRRMTAALYIQGLLALQQGLNEGETLLLLKALTGDIAFFTNG